MSFATDIDKLNKNKIVLVEIDIPIIQTTWINYTSGIWYIRFIEENEVLTDDQGEDYTYPANVINIPSIIGSCLVDFEYCTSVGSLALCQSTNKSYFHDVTNNLFYIHLDSFEPVLNKIIRIGVIEGYCEKNDTSAYYSDVYYDPRVTKIPSLSEKKDPLFFGIQKFKSGNVSLINSDGHFDSYNDLNIYGQPARIKVGFEGYDYADFQQIFEGFIEDYSYDFNTFNLKIQDKRKNLSRKIPYNQFSQSFYPDLNDDDVGKWKPIVFGLVYYMPVVCINKDETTPTNRTFMFLDTEFGDADALNNSELKAYVKNDEDSNIYDEITVASVSTTDGTFNVLSANVDNDDDIPKDVFVKCYGYEDVLDSIEVLECLIDNFSDIEYTTVFFDTTEISTEFSSARDIGIFIEKPKSIIDIIGDLMFADDGYFYVQADGKYSAKKFDSARSSSVTIQNYQWIGEPSISYNTNDLLSSVTIQAKKHYARNKYLLSPTNTTYQDEVLYKYKKYQTKEFKTILIDNSDAEDKAENIMLQTKDIVRVVKRLCDMSAYDIDIMDIVTTSVQRQSDDELLEEWQVIGKTFDLTNFTIMLELKYWGTA